MSESIADLLREEAAIIDAEGATGESVDLLVDAADEITTLRQQLEQAQAESVQAAQQGSVPEGWRLVPENATSEMVFAPQFGAVEHSPKPSVLFEVWRAMVEAAPEVISD